CARGDRAGSTTWTTWSPRAQAKSYRRSRNTTRRCRHTIPTRSDGCASKRVSVLFKILIGIVGLLALIAAVAATLSSAYHVERKVDVAAPVDIVFAVLNDLRQFSGVMVLFGSTLEKNDPNMQKTFEGPAAGVGQSWAWSGKKAGEGSLTIEASVPGQKVTMK